MERRVDVIHLSFHDAFGLVSHGIFIKEIRNIRHP